MAEFDRPYTTFCQFAVIIAQSCTNLLVIWRCRKKNVVTLRGHSRSF